MSTVSSIITFFFFLSLTSVVRNVMSQFVIECGQARVAGRTLTQAQVDSGDVDSGALVFDFYQIPGTNQNQLLSASQGVNTWTMNETITDGMIEFDVFPLNDGTPGMYPQLMVSLNGNYLVNSQTNQTIFNTGDAEISLSFTTGFLGNGQVDAYNEFTLNVFAYVYMNGYSTCSQSYKFNITNPQFSP